MKKFLYNSLVFISPIILLQVLTYSFYSVEKGDLLRLGSLMHTYDYRPFFAEEFQRENYFSNLSELDLEVIQEFTVLTIGDSFSQPSATGFKNYLAERNDITVVHFDKNVNAFQTLTEILNGDILEKINVKFIIVQAVERHIVERAFIQNDSPPLCRDTVKEVLNPNSNNINIKDLSLIDQIKSGLFFKIPLYNLLYFLDDNAFDSQTYRLKTTENLFSNPSKDFLFYHLDVENVEHNNSIKGIRKLNQELNLLSVRLKEKGIQLIVLPSPDKYDFYYEYIKEKEKYPEPKFFELFEKEKKNFLYLNSKRILKERGGKKDVYFYGDTHWSPIAAKVIADGLAEIINANINNVE